MKYTYDTESAIVVWRGHEFDLNIWFIGNGVSQFGCTLYVHALEVGVKKTQYVITDWNSKNILAGPFPTLESALAAYEVMRHEYPE